MPNIVYGDKPWERRQRWPFDIWSPRYPIYRDAENTQSDEAVTLLRIDNDAKSPALIALKTPGGLYDISSDLVDAGQTKDHSCFKGVYDVYIACGKQTVIVSGLDLTTDPCEVTVNKILNGDRGDLPISASKISVGPDSTASDYFSKAVISKLSEVYKSSPSDKIETIIAKLTEASTE